MTNADVIAHGVAPNDHFEQGLALSLRERWPAMYKDFRHNMHTSHPKEGGLDWSEVEPMIDKHLGDADFDVYLYVEYHKG